MTGKSWGEFLRERIFGPLDMTSTRVFSHDDIIPNRAPGYNHFGDVPVNGLWFTPAMMESAAGGLLSTVEDMAKWEIALEKGTILKPSTLAQMEVPVKLKNDSTVQETDGTRHGMGWDLETYQGHRIVSHGGDHVTGFTAYFGRFVDDELAVIVLTKHDAVRYSHSRKKGRRVLCPHTRHGGGKTTVGRRGRVSSCPSGCRAIKLDDIFLDMSHARQSFVEDWSCGRRRVYLRPGGGRTPDRSGRPS